MGRALVLLFLLLGCSNKAAPVTAKPASPRERCCAECTAAASRDPAGMDISGKTCTSYPADWNGAAGVDDECRAWFVAQPRSTTVGDCAKAEPDMK